MNIKFLGCCTPPDDIAVIALQVSKTNIPLERYWWVAYEPKKKKVWAGFSGAIMMPYKEKLVLYFGPVYVKPEHRGKALQRKLLEAKLNYAFTEHNYDMVVTSVYSSNIRSCNNLIKSGFKMIESFEQIKELVCFAITKQEWAAQQ